MPALIERFVLTAPGVRGEGPQADRLFDSLGVCGLGGRRRVRQNQAEKFGEGRCAFLRYAPMRIRLALAATLLLTFPAADPAAAEDVAASPASDTMCALIAAAAQTQGLPVPFLTRLIWQESSFQPGVTSPAGAQGVAQFMPGTAAARGLANPYDPQQAIPKAAELLAYLKGQFGNLGLAAAAYNAGMGRVAGWLSGGDGLPTETRAYVSAVTGHPVEEWVAGGAAVKADEAVLFPNVSCPAEVAVVRAATPAAAALSALTAPWGVQIAGSFSKAAALAIYQRARTVYAGALSDREPIVIGGRLRSRGFNAFYRVRAPAATRVEAQALCNTILRAGGACVVLRN